MSLTFAVITSDGDWNMMETQEGDKLQTLQTAVGGYIEYLPLGVPKLAAYINEDGYVLELPANRVASDILRDLGNRSSFGPAGMVLGPVVFVGVDGEKEVSLTPGQLAQLYLLYRARTR